MIRNHHRPWTEAEDQKLMAMLAKGRSAISISVALRRTTGAVESRASIVRGKARNTNSDHSVSEIDDA